MEPWLDDFELFTQLNLFWHMAIFGECLMKIV